MKLENLTIRAVLADTFRLRLKPGDTLHAPRTTAADAAKLYAAALSPSYVANFMQFSCTSTVYKN